MMQKALLLLLFVSSLFAQSYSFTELRYSDAINRYTQLEGEITFSKNGVNIKYPQNAKEIDYKDGALLYYEKSKKIELPQMQASQMMRYFETLLLLHSGDESELQEMFEITESEDKKILKPFGMIKNYINYIELRKDRNVLAYIKLFLKNNDTISININD